MAEKEDMLELLEGFAKQAEEASRVGKDTKIEGEVETILIAGIGGSAISASILKTYLEQKIRIPVILSNDYDIPESVNSKTLVIAISYSGDTEETVAAVNAALRKSAKVLGVTSGGKLRQLCSENDKECIVLPKGIQSRFALGYLFFPILNVLHNSKIIKNPKPEVEQAVEALKVQGLKDKAEALASRLVDKVPVIYSSNKLAAAAAKWKIGFNEYAKIHAFYNVFPELNHNEISGYMIPKAKFHVIILKDEGDSVKIQERMKMTKQLIADRGIDVTEIIVKGYSPLAKIFSAIHTGDMVSYFLGLKYEIDPSKIDIQEEFKKKITKKL
ncbi:MAG: bifunctional phosphoglucose/phosphomannose isomerase [bacterium]|nr:bifunctional phosphoglucose/phosphomannose isomerase [bacterium]